MAKLQVEDVAPDFTLNDEQGKEITLSSFRGKNPVVLIFYPADETPGCTKQLCAARDDFDQYVQAGVVAFGVNNGSEASHQKFIKKHGLKTPLLVDKGLEVAGQYDAVMGLGPLKIINRTVVGIDLEGRVVFYKRGTPNTREILAAIDQATATR